MTESDTGGGPYQAEQQALLDRAAAEIFRFELIATDERLGRLLVKLSPKEEGHERVFLQGEIELFRDEVSDDELAAATADGIVETFEWHLDDLNDRFVTARQRWFRYDFVDIVEERVRERLAKIFDEALIEDLSFDIEDAGWMPSHHGTLPEEVERPWPNLAIAVTHLEREDVAIWVILDWFEPLEHLDVTELTERVEEALKADSGA